MSESQDPSPLTEQDPSPQPEQAKPEPWGGVPTGVPVTDDKDERQWMMFAHLTGLFGILGPLIVYIVKKDDKPIIVQEAKEAVNFHLTMLIAYFATSLIAVASCGFLSFIVVVPYVISTVFAIIAGLEANKGIPYRYPLNIRMIT